MSVEVEERYERLCRLIEDAAQMATYLPVQRTIGAGYAVQADMVVGIPPLYWQAIVDALNENIAE